MNKIKIFADSTSDIPVQWREQYEISIVPLYTVFGDESLRDGVDIKPEQLFQRVSREGHLPRTAAPAPSDFIQAFAPYIEQGDDILCISLSSELSSTYQNALLAASEFPEDRITVFDSLNLSCGFGMLVMKAARAAANGSTLEQIVDMLTRTRPLIDTEFVIDTLEYLYKGGRCSGMQNLIGSLLKIRPVIKVIDGKMTPAYKVRGKREKALEQMLQNALNQREHMDNDIIVVVHALAEEDALMLQARLQKETGAQEVLLTTAGCVISSHCGPQTIGIMYAKKE